MKCMKCEGKMIDATLITDEANHTLTAMTKKKGFLESPRISNVSCFVCVDCGYIELKADHPQVLIIK